MPFVAPDSDVAQPGSQKQGPSGFVAPSQDLRPENLAFTNLSPWEIQQMAGEYGMQEFGKAAVSGAIEGSMATYGMVRGAQVGKMLPGGALTTAAGAVGGLVLGSLAGQGVREGGEELGLLTGDVYDLPEDQRPIAAAGETFGFMVGGMRLPFMLRNRGLFSSETGRIGKWFNGMINSATRSPKTYTALELGTAGVVSSAAFSATQEDPNNPLMRMGYELMAGGVVAASRGALNKAGNIVSRVFANLSPTIRENQALYGILKVFQENGEDPALVAKLIRQLGGEDFVQKYMPDIDPNQMGLTGDQVSGSVSLISIANTLKQTDKLFGSARIVAEREAFDALRAVVNVMKGIGDPKALQAVAEIKTAYVRGVLQERLATITKEARDYASRAVVGSPDEWSKLSSQVHEQVSQVLKDARALESQIWSRVPTDGQAVAPGFAETYRYWKGELQEFAADDIPKAGSQLMARIGDDTNPSAIEHMTPESAADYLAGLASGGSPEPLTIGSLIKARSALLDEARKASRAGELRRAKAAGDMAEAIMKDIETQTAGNSAYEEARLYSKELNDVFTRTFVGEAFSDTRFGKRVSPESLIREMIAGHPEARDLKMRQIENATRFMIGRTEDTDVEILNAGRLATVLEAQERMIRLAAESAIEFDPVTREVRSVSAKRMNDFLKKWDETLRRFPKTHDLLKSVVTSEETRASFERMVKGRTRAIENRGLFAKLVKGNPVKVAQAAVMGSNPEGDIAALARIAKRSQGTHGLAIDGLRAALIEGVMISSRGDNYTINLPKFFNILNQPVVGGKQSIAEIMLSNGVINKDHLDQIQQLGQLVQSMTKAKTLKTATQKVDTGIDQFFDVVVRGVGVKAAQKFQDITGSRHSLIFEGAGARFARSFLSSMPEKKVETLIAHWLADPVALADALERGARSSVIEMNQQMHLYLFTSGVLNMPDFVEQEIDTRLAP